MTDVDKLQRGGFVVFDKKSCIRRDFPAARFIEGGAIFNKAATAILRTIPGGQILWMHDPETGRLGFGVDRSSNRAGRPIHFHRGAVQAFVAAQAMVRDFGLQGKLGRIEPHHDETHGDMWVFGFDEEAGQ